jgi:hypothetical protein
MDSIVVYLSNKKGIKFNFRKVKILNRMDLRIKPIGKGNYKEYNSSNLNTNNLKSVSPLNATQMAKNLLENSGNESLLKQRNMSWVEKYKMKTPSSGTKTPTPKAKTKAKAKTKKSKNKIHLANNTGYNANTNSPKKSTRKSKRY